MAYRQRQAGTIGARTGGKLIGSDKIVVPTTPALLKEAKKHRIQELWVSADAYEKQFFSGGAFAQILEAKILGDPKAIAIRNWLNRLWLDYYNRKDIINVRGTVEEVRAIDISFSGHGCPPYSIRDLLNEAALRVS
jgi:hypothetical protein